LVRGNTVSGPVVAELPDPVLADPSSDPSGERAVTSNESDARTLPTTLLVTWIFDVLIAKATAERANVVIVNPIVDGVSAPTTTSS
jgi:hypothetical protein